MDRSNKIRVVTADNVVFNVEIDILYHSLQLKRILENHAGIDDEFNVVEDAEPIRLRKTRSEVFRPILEWLQNHKNDPISLSRNNRILPDGFDLQLEALNASYHDDDVQIVKWNDEPSVVEDPKMAPLKRIAAEMKKSVFEFHHMDVDLSESDPLVELLSKARKSNSSFNAEQLVDVDEIDEMNDFCPSPSKSEMFLFPCNIPDSTPQPLLSQWDIAFFQKMSKEVLFQVIKTSRNIQLHELNRHASIFAAMNMGSTPEAIENYFDIDS